MPLRTPSPTELEYLKSQGIDTTQNVQVDENFQMPGGGATPSGGEMSKTEAAINTLKAHAGGLAAGGVGTLATGSALSSIAALLGAPETGGLSLALLVPSIIGGGIAAKYGQQGYEKGLDILGGPGTNEKIQQAAQQAEQEHPFISGATDITGSALLSGGRPSLKNLMNIRNDREALMKVITGAGIVPAVNTGIDLAQGNPITAKGIMEQVAGGALFSEPYGSSARKVFNRLAGEPISEPNYKPAVDEAANQAQANMAKQPDNPVNKREQLPPPNIESLIGEEGASASRQSITEKVHEGGVGEINDKIKPTETINPDPNAVQALAENTRKSQEYARMQAEKVSQLHDPGQELPPQPLSAEEVKALNPETLLQSNIARPEVREGEQLNVNVPKEKGTENATETGKQQPSEELQHQGANEQRLSAETGGSDRIQPGQERPQEKTFEKSLGGLGQWLSKGFFSTVNRIRNIGRPLAKALGDQAYKYETKKNSIIGTQLNPIMKAAERLTPEQDHNLELASRAKIEGQNPMTFLKTPEEVNAFNTLQKSLQLNIDNRRAIGEMIVDPTTGARTLPTHSNTFQPTTTEPRVIEDIKQGRGNKWKDTFVDYQQKLGASRAEAEMNWKGYVDSLTNVSGMKSRQQYYSGARKPEQYALPPEMTRKGWARNAEVYFNRMARDNAFAEHIQGNTKAMQALGIKTDLRGNPVPDHPDGNLMGHPEVQAFMHEVGGESMTQSDYNEKKISSATTALMLGPLTELHKFVATQIGMLSSADNAYQLSRMIGHSIKNFSAGLQHAEEAGLIKYDSKRMSQIADSSLTWGERIGVIAKGAKNIYTLKDLTTKVSNGLAQSMAEGIIPNKLELAAKGNTTLQEFFRQIDPDYKPGKVYGPDGVQRLASEMVARIQGTGDARTMPPWMLKDNEISGFLRMAHWSTSQTGRFLNDIALPAKNGDYAPLFRNVFGAAVGGYLLKELREQMSGKKGGIPSLAEIASSSRGVGGNLGAIGYNLVAAAQLAGFGGLMATMAKAPFDAIYRNKPSGMIFPIDEFASDFAKTATDVIGAYANDPNFDTLEVAKAIGMHQLTSNIQLSRIAINQAINHGLITGMPAEKKALADKLGELRRWQMTEGMVPTEQGASDSNPYMDLQANKFKLEQNPQEAMKQLPGLISNIMQTYQSNPDVMMQKLQGLKQNSYATMPSPDTEPLQFMKYHDYLTRLFGEDHANAAIMDYMRHKVINEAKGSVVP